MTVKTLILKSTYSITERLYEDLVSYCYEGRHLKTNQQVLIWQYKVEAKNSELIQRLIQRCESLIGITHPQLIQIKDYVFDGHGFYTIHDFVPQMKPLDTYLKDENTRTLKALWKFSKQLLSLLVTLEQYHLYCGSISMSCIHIDNQGQLRVIHTAIGIDVLLSFWDDVTISEDCLFLAPEVIHKQHFSTASDIYALGVLFYLFFSSTWPYPFTMEVEAYKKSLVQGPIRFKKRAPKIPDRLGALIMTCLNSDISSRFSTIENLINAYKGVQPLSLEDHQSPSKIQLELAKEIEEKQKESLKTKIQVGVGLGLITISIGLIMFLYYGYTRAIPNQVIPNVIGMKSEHAFTVLESYQFPIIIAGKRTHSEYQAGTVIEMSPPAGRVVKKNRQIRLFVSSGKEPLIVPDLIGRTKDQADKLLLEKGAIIRIERDEFSAQYPEGVVISQRPTPNTVLGADPIINLVLSKGFPVEVTQQSISEGFFNFQKSKVRIHIQLDILAGWEDQQILITYKRKKKEVLYEKKHQAGDRVELTYKLEKDGQLEIYFNGDVAYND